MKDEMPDVILVTNVITATDAWQPIDAKWSWGAYKNHARTSYTRTDIHESEVKRLRDALELARKALAVSNYKGAAVMTAIDAALKEE